MIKSLNNTNIANFCQSANVAFYQNLMSHTIKEEFELMRDMHITQLRNNEYF